LISRASLGFVVSSVLYMVIGLFLGAYMFSAGIAGGNVMWMHAHLNLVGFVAMMIFGVAYHALPRFIGAPLHSDLLAEAHFVLANIGLLGMVGAMLATGRGTALTAFAFLEAFSGLLFAYNVVMTAMNR